jgi:hypothetical protein
MTAKNAEKPHVSALSVACANLSFRPNIRLDAGRAKATPVRLPSGGI